MDWKAAAYLLLDTAVNYVKCELSSRPTRQTLSPEQEAALPGDILQCALGAFIEYAMSNPKDLNKAIQSFLTCFLSKFGGGLGGGGTTPTPVSDGPVFREVGRCT
jgi:hypothetical protein